MRQSTMKTKSNSHPELKVIRGFFHEETEVAPLVHSAWNFAYSSLWNAVQFSTKEINAAKENITEYFQLAKDPRKAFLSFCQRVLLARQYISGGKERYMPIPSQWFDKNNEVGFAGTKTWYADIRNIRASLPNYKQEIKALAEAVLEYSEEPTIQNFHYWRAYFIDKGTPGLLNLFQVNAINQQFIRG